MTLFPVVLPTTENVKALSGTQKVALLSKCARQALKLSADKAGVILGELAKDKDDVPLPSGGYYWSISHKPKYVAAVISDSRVGIDIEEIKPRNGSIFNYVASEEEWKLCGGKSWEALYRCWTAKEAVVKAAGTGLAGLKSCQVHSVPDETHIFLYYQDRSHEVEQLHYNGHILSVLKDNNEVNWITPEVLKAPLS